MSIVTILYGSVWGLDMALRSFWKSFLPLFIFFVGTNLLLRKVLEISKVSRIYWAPVILVCQTQLLAATVLLVHELYLELNLSIWIPYMGLKLFALVLAVAAPPRRWESWMCFFILATAPVLQYFGVWGGMERIEMGTQEPWISIATVAVSILIWFYRLKVIELACRQAQLTARARVFERIARLLVGAQHLMNSPLQTIDANINLLNLENPSQQPRLEILQRSFAKVIRVSKAMSLGQLGNHWDEKEIPANLDELEKNIQQLLSELKG